LEKNLCPTHFWGAYSETILVDYCIEQRRVRSKARWFWMASLAAINQHLDAQDAGVNQKEKPNCLNP